MVRPLCFCVFDLTFVTFSSIRVDMRRLTREQRVRVVAALVEGCSVRATVRMTGVSKPTVLKLLVDLGRACSEFQDRTLRNLPCKRLECDEAWAFVYAKQKNVRGAIAAPEGAGDVWTWVALDAETKLVASWLVGPRDLLAAEDFMRDLCGRLASRVQITTHGHKAYVQAVESSFGADVDFAQLVKLYGADRPGEARYSPASFVSSRKIAVTGEPNMELVSTSYVERQNLSLRMHMRRFTRLTNGFSKKFENHAAAVAIHFCFYNFARVHQTLRVTPAMAAGVSDHVWEIEEIVALLEATEPSASDVAARSSALAAVTGG